MVKILQTARSLGAPVGMDLRRSWCKTRIAPIADGVGSLPYADRDGRDV
jgi:hypothetical protein